MKSYVGCYKIGLQLFCAHGPELVRQANDLGTPVFLDLKLHDIPNTVTSAIKSLHSLNIKFLTIHTQGGPQMIKAAREALSENSGTQLLGVTILTSFDDAGVQSLGYHRTASTASRFRARGPIPCHHTHTSYQKWSNPHRHWPPYPQRHKPGTSDGTATQVTHAGRIILDSS